jgi:hypothetical protein
LPQFGENELPAVVDVVKEGRRQQRDTCFFAQIEEFRNDYCWRHDLGSSHGSQTEDGISRRAQLARPFQIPE